MFKDTLLKQYKKDLELEDWEIWVVIGKTTHVRFNTDKKTATVSLNKGDLPYKDYWLLHELYHVKFPFYKEKQIDNLTVKYLRKHNIR